MITMQQKDFSELLERYLNGTCSPEEKEMVDRWFESVRPPQRDLLSSDEELKLFQLYKKDLIKAEIREDEKTFSSSFYRTIWFKAAAAVLIFLTTLLFLFTAHTYEEPRDIMASEDETSSVKTVFNDESSAMAVVLKDGSEVILNPGASLSFDTQFGDSIRQVQLEGEAFFDVITDPSKPFIVKAGRLTTRVLGTSFSVKQDVSDELVTVTVKTGRVSLRPISADVGQNFSEEVLIPNQQAVYDAKAGTFVREQVEKPQGIGPENIGKGLRFHEEPVAKILHALERCHETKIVFDENDFGGCLLSTSLLPDENVFTRLGIICRATGATYRVDGLHIVVKGKPCE